jgi:enoyl-CoA hydratase
VSATAEPALVVERRGPVTWLTLNRPHKHNALDGDLITGLCDFFATVGDDAATRVVVLRGNGPSFCAGLDLKAHLTDGRRTRRIVELMPLIRACPQPVVSLIHGNARGGGFVLALASDLRIAGESACMADAFIDLGLSGADVGISWFLPRLVGLSLASELMLTGRTLDAARAERLGLVMEVVADHDLERVGADVANGLVAKSQLGLRRTKEILNDAFARDDLAETIDLEVRAQIEVSRDDPAFAARSTRFGAGS